MHATSAPGKWRRRGTAAATPTAAVDDAGGPAAARETSPQVRRACTEQVNRAIFRTTMLGVPGAAVLAVILGSSVPANRRLAFVLAVTVADLIAFAVTGWYVMRCKRGEPVDGFWLGPLAVALVGVSWSSLSVFALPGPERVDLRAVYLLFVCGTSATYVVAAAGRRLYYFASQIPMLTIITVAFALSGDHVTRLLSAAIPIYFAVMTLMHHEVHDVVVRELQLREQNQQTAAALRRANRELARRALRDELTGVANRASFMESLDRALVSARQHDQIIGVVYIDLDRFKVVNDSLGHGGGDELLAAVAYRLRGSIHDDDVIARLGGDEFAILLHDLATRDEALEVAHRIRRACATPFPICERRVNVTASIGVTTNIRVDDDAETLLRHADAAQYRAKQAGRDRVEVFDLGLREAIQRRLENEEELRDAIEKGEIVPWYQPQMEIVSGDVVGAEALARWMHPTRGVLEAGAFVPVAEGGALTYALDATITQAAAGGIARLAADGVVGDGFRVWCNVSRDQLTRAQPAERLAELLERSGCSPEHIGIEITESSVLADVDAVAPQVAAARELGVHVALDDFGTGPSSLTLLRSLPVDLVKIDRSFVRDVTTDDRAAAIIRHLIALAYDLGIRVVAEGVETPEQAGRLSDLGCRFAQGFLWSKAVPLCDFAKVVRAQHREEMRRGA
jgi:diguanylate cyclase (GGDEF)-like protein